MHRQKCSRLRGCAECAMCGRCTCGEEVPRYSPEYEAAQGLGRMLYLQQRDGSTRHLATLQPRGNASAESCLVEGSSAVGLCRSMSTHQLVQKHKSQSKLQGEEREGYACVEHSKRAEVMYHDYSLEKHSRQAAGTKHGFCCIPINRLRSNSH
eukprot:353972-Chlamydomonas_euryale.AAC.6